MYNYLEEIKSDIEQYLEDNLEYEYSDCTDIDELEERLNDDLFIKDCITGNASGSYTFNRYKAQEYVVDNMDELKDALENFCIDAETVVDKFINEVWEYFDVTIRCHLLSQAISEVLEENKDDFERFLEENEEE